MGLNVPRPPDLFHLYRDYGKHVIPPKEMVDAGCGEDTIEEAQPEEAEADIAMAFDQERLQMVSKNKFESFLIYKIFCRCDMIPFGIFVSFYSFYSFLVFLFPY